MPNPLPADRPIACSDATDSQASTRSLVARANRGDRSAADRVFDRLIRRVRRWARGRLARNARDLTDTVDVVQDAAAGTWRRFGHIELNSPGDLEAYIRQAVLNRIRDEARRADRRPDPSQLDSQIPDEGPTPYDRALAAEDFGRFEQAFAQLTPDARTVILAKRKYGYTFEEIAALFGKPSEDAARMAFNRAMAQLDELMKAGRG